MKVVLPVVSVENGSRATHVIVTLDAPQCAAIVEMETYFSSVVSLAAQSADLKAPVSLLGFDLRHLPLLTEFIEVLPAGYPCLDAIDALGEGDNLVITDAQYAEISEVIAENAAYINTGACEYVITQNTGYERTYIESVDMDTMDGITVQGFHLAVQAVIDAIIAAA